MKQAILTISILLMGCIAKGDNYLDGHGRHMIVNEWYPNGTTYTVTANNGIVSIQLENTYINLHGQNASGADKDFKPCIDIQEGNQVRIILRGTSELWGGTMCPAIRVHPKSQLFIEDGGGGKLIAHGGVNTRSEWYYEGGRNTRDYNFTGGAGIGGGWDYCKPSDWPSGWDSYYVWNFEIPAGQSLSDLPYLPDQYRGTDWMGMFDFWSKGYGACGDIIINSGTVEAYGGKDSPGIGPAGNYTKGGRIEIQDGSVYAKGGENAPGIGCAAESYVYEIKVTGGNVIAEGGKGAPGIGGAGPHCYIEHINLEGGNITAEASGGDAVGIGTGQNSKINHINIYTNVTAESNRVGIPAIGALDGSAIEHIQIFGGNVIAKNGIGKTGEVKDLVISHIEFHNGVVDASVGGVAKGNGGTWKTYPNVSAVDLLNYKLPTLENVENPVYEKHENTTVELPDHMLAENTTTVYTIYVGDETLTTTEGLTVKVGDEVYEYETPDRQQFFVDVWGDRCQTWYFAYEETREVTVYRDDRLIYKETAREILPNQYFEHIPHHHVYLSKVFTAGFDVFGENTGVNTAIRYHDELYPNNSSLTEHGEGEVTFIVHGATENDVPDYRYIWYQDGIQVAEGENKNTYTVNRESDEDVLGYSVRLETVQYPAGIEAVSSNNTVRRLLNQVVIDTPHEETIKIYSLNGVLIKKVQKAAGVLRVDLSNDPLRKVLVVKGADWVRKVW
ncbi:MAG: hypothetical protein LBF08_00955 [Dysgonamonadaceae bacterium]|jgi:hypothetical protein|nr:hypothetical protein [Dysgonamonadaceae bacterium]